MWVCLQELSSFLWSVLYLDEIPKLTDDPLLGGSVWDVTT